MGALTSLLQDSNHSYDPVCRPAYLCDSSALPISQLMLGNSAEAL